MRSMSMPKRTHQIESFAQAEQGMGVGEGHAVIGAGGRAVVERTINWVASCVLYRRSGVDRSAFCRRRRMSTAVRPADSIGIDTVVSGGAHMAA
jgi:hypothetical protein